MHATPHGPIRRIAASPLLRSLAAVASSTAMGQAIAFAFSPLITRIYSPEAFGIQGVFIALVSVLWPLAGLRYPMAIVVARDEAEVRGLVRLSVWLAGGVSCLTGLALIALRNAPTDPFGLRELGLLVYLLPPALFLVTLQDVMDYRAVRLAAFRTIGVVIVAQSFLINLARVLGGLAAPIAATLIVVTSLSYGVQALMLKLGLARRTGRIVAPKRPAPLRTVLRAHCEFPLYRMPADLISALAQTIPVFLLTWLFSPAAAGFYALARSVVNLPLNVIGTAVGNVLYSRMADMARSNTPLFGFVAKATLAHLLLPGVATAIVAFAFPALFGFVFGEVWRPAGAFAQWMALWVVGMLANIPAVRVLPVIGAQRLHLVFNLLLMVGGVAGMLAGHMLYGTAMASVAGYSIATASLYVAQIATYLYRVRRYDHRTSSHA